MIKIDIYDLLCLCDKLSHRVDEQDETIEYYQKEIKRLHKVFDIKDSQRAGLIEENKKLKSCLTIADNDYKNCYAENIRLSEENNKLQCDINDLKQTHNEIRLLNNQIDNLQRNIGYLCEENTRLRHELNEVQSNDNNY